jgi:anti-sigma factor (TIGR02949 family)
MNCQEALSLLYDIIDKEASEINAAEVREHLAKCQHCFQIYNLEHSVNALVVERLKSVDATPCVEKLRDKLILKLNEIDAESACPAKPAARKPFGGTALTLAIAASVIVVAGAAFIGNKLYDHHEVFIPLEQAHWRAAKGINVPGEIPLTGDNALALAKSVQYPISASTDGFTLVNGHVEELMGTRMVHFIYRQGDKVVSVFVAPASSFDIPASLQGNPVTVNGYKLFDHNCRGCRLVYHRERDVIVITATTNREIDLLAFDPGHGAI